MLDFDFNTAICYQHCARAGGFRRLLKVVEVRVSASGGSCLARSVWRCDQARLQQFRVVRQKLLYRLLDQHLDRDAAQDRGKLEPAVFGLCNPRAELGLGLGAAGGQARMGRNRAAFQGL